MKDRTNRGRVRLIRAERSQPECKEQLVKGFDVARQGPSSLGEEKDPCRRQTDLTKPLRTLKESEEPEA